MKKIVKQIMSGYAGKALNGYSYLTQNTEGDMLTIVSVAEIRGQRVVDTGLVVRLEGEQIVIERDVNDKLLVDALVQAGIDRHKIILAYAGELNKQTRMG